MVAVRRVGRPMPSSLLAVGALILAMLSFTSGASVAKQLFPLIGAEGATALRVMLAALMLAAAHRPWRARVPAAAWPPVLVYGLALGAMNLLFYMALRSLPLGVAIALEFTGPLAVAILSSRRWIDLLWIGFAVGGLVLLLPLGIPGARVDPQGFGLALGAGGCWAVYILAGKRAGQDHGAMATAIGMAVAALAVAPIGLAHAGQRLFQPSVALLAPLVAVLSGALPFTLEMFALRRLPARTYGTLTSAEPAVGAMVAFWMLGESLPLAQWGAIGMIVVASVGATATALREQSGRSRPGSQSRRGSDGFPSPGI